MRIGELARVTGVDEQLLRYYERQGLLEPARAANGYREYAQHDVTVVRRIRALLEAGLSTAAIAELGTCVRGEVPAPACGKAMELLRAQHAKLRETIARLEETRGALEEVMGRG